MPRAPSHFSAASFLGALERLAVDCIVGCLDDYRLRLVAAGVPLPIVDELAGAADELGQLLTRAVASIAPTEDAPDWLRSMIDGLDHDGGQLP